MEMTLVQDLCNETEPMSVDSKRMSSKWIKTRGGSYVWYELQNSCNKCAVFLSFDSSVLSSYAS